MYVWLKVFQERYFSAFSPWDTFIKSTIRNKTFTSTTVDSINVNREDR